MEDRPSNRRREREDVSGRAAVEGPVPDARRELGSQAEDIAVALLEDAGCMVVDRNWRYGHVGELDIVCRKDDLLIFVEVRSASTRYLRTPALTVNSRKQLQVIRVARCYMARPWLAKLGCRFDVVAVIFQDGDVARTEWIPDAFRPQSTARSPIYQA